MSYHLLILWVKTGAVVAPWIVNSRHWNHSPLPLQPLPLFPRSSHLQPLVQDAERIELQRQNLAGTKGKGKIQISLMGSTVDKWSIPLSKPCPINGKSWGKGPMQLTFGVSAASQAGPPEIPPQQMSLSLSAHLILEEFASRSAEPSLICDGEMIDLRANKQLNDWTQDAEAMFRSITIQDTATVQPARVVRTPNLLGWYFSNHVGIQEREDI